MVLGLLTPACLLAPSQSRRREQERLERLDEEWEAMKQAEDFQRKQEELRRADEERTAKKRAARQKKKVGRWSLCSRACSRGCPACMLTAG
jgi:hypothetical protein